jgi:cation diffusion facilitator family transporter
MKPSNKRAIFVSLAGNLGISASKAIAAALTGSSGMMAEAIHSLVDTTHELFLLLGVHQAQSPADDRFPYGRGKAVYFWGFIAVVFFMGGGFLAIQDGVDHILHPQPVEASLFGYLILAIAFVLDGVALVEALKQFTRTKGDTSFMNAFKNTRDPSMRILIFENSLDIIGESVAFLGILLAQVTGILYFDGIASIIVGSMLVASALGQANQIKNLLIGQSADDYVVAGIRDLVAGQSQVCGIEELTTLHMGPDYILVNLRLRFEDSVVVQDVERTSNYLEEQIRDRFPIAKRVYVAASTHCWNQSQPIAYGWPIRTATVREETTR